MSPRHFVEKFSRKAAKAVEKTLILIFKNNKDLAFLCELCVLARDVFDFVWFILEEHEKSYCVTGVGID